MNLTPSPYGGHIVLTERTAGRVVMHEAERADFLHSLVCHDPDCVPCQERRARIAAFMAANPTYDDDREAWENS